MKPESKKIRSHLRPFSVVFWFALIFGAVFAIGSYMLVLFPKNEWMRSTYLSDVEHDSPLAFASRFLLGAVGGAVIGLLHGIRDIRDEKKGENDDP